MLFAWRVPCFERKFGMPKFMLIVAALLFVMAQVFAPFATAGEAMRSSGDIPQIIAFDNW
jgi:hypothetical protein